MHAWNRPVSHDCPYIRLKVKLQRTAKDLRIWSKSLFSKAKMQFHMANEIILRLDISQENRQLTQEEFALRKMLKTRVLGLAAIERAGRRQASRVLWIRAGDASTKFFHAKCNNRRRKNYIHTLQTAGGEVLSQHQEKAQEIFRHFSNQLGKRKNRRLTINWDQLQ